MINNSESTQIINKLIDNGVQIPCPDGVIIEKSVKIGKDTVIMPNTVLMGDVKIGTDCVIGPNSYIVDTQIGNNTKLNNTQSFSSKIGSGVTA